MTNDVERSMILNEFNTIIAMIAANHVRIDHYDAFIDDAINAATTLEEMAQIRSMMSQTRALLDKNKELLRKIR